MNRKQRRAMEREALKATKKGKALSYDQGAIIAEEAYKKGRDVADIERANIFMYTTGLIIKVLHEQWGWGHVRLGRLVNQLLTEYNNTDMNLEEIQKWCWEFGGFKLQIEDEAK